MSGRVRHLLMLFRNIASTIYTLVVGVLTFFSWDQIGISDICCRARLIFSVIPLSAILACIFFYITNKNTIWKQGNASITLRYGDLNSIAFPKHKKKQRQKRIVLISMNTHYDTLVNDRVVSAASVHGQWIGWMKEAGVEPDELNRRIQIAAKEQKLAAVRTDQKEGNKEAYPIGTIIELAHENTRFFLLALSEFDDNLNAQTGKEQIIDVLKKICYYYDLRGCGQHMYTPLIGTDQSRAKLTERESVMLMKNIFLLYRDKIHNELSIVIFHKHRHELSLFE